MRASTAPVLPAADALNPGIIMRTMRHVALRGTQGCSRVSTRLLDGEHATGTVARAPITRCAHATWQLHPSAMRLRDGITHWRTQQVPAGTTACVHGRCRHRGSHAACAFVGLCCAARDALRCTRWTDSAAQVRAAHDSDRVNTRPLHSRLSRCAARRGGGPRVRCCCARPTCTRPGPALQKSAAGRSAVLAAGAVGDCGMQGVNRHGGHWQTGCERPAGARILPSPVNAGPGRGARRRQQRGRAPRPAWVPPSGSGEPRAAGRVRAIAKVGFCRKPG